MIIKSEEDLINIKKSSLLVGKTLGEIAIYLCPGITTKKLDIIAEDYIRSYSGIPAFKGYKGYPSTLCISLNDAVVHGIPDNTEIKEGDVVSIDCGINYCGYYSDYAYTYLIGEACNETIRLIKITKESLYLGINEAVSGNKTGNIGHAIQQFVEKNGFSVVRELTGHGIGKSLHEKPEIPNYGKKGNGETLTEGMVLCIEPMINIGKKEIFQDKDGWTIRTKDGKLSAHFEHMVLVKNISPEVLSTYEYIEKNIINNIWLNNPL